MTKIKDTTFDKIQANLFTSKENLPKLSNKELEILDRYKKVFTYWINNPASSNKQIFNYMHYTLNISESQCYRDIPKITLLLGNVRLASKEWYRYMVIQMAQKAFEVAKAKNDAKSMAIAADKIGKYTKCDKEDIDEFPWDKIFQPAWEPSADIKILNLKPIKNLKEVKAKLIKKYTEEIKEDEFFMLNNE